MQDVQFGGVENSKPSRKEKNPFITTRIPIHRVVKND
jgi:hypothetical protein